MEAFIQRVFKIRQKELGLVLALGFLLFGNSLARQVSGIVAVSGFLNSSSVNSMLLVMLIDYTLILVVGGLQSLVVDRFNRVKLIGFITIGFALLFLIIRLLFALGAPPWLNYSLMYLIAEQQLILFPVVFWVLANDIFNFAQAQRLFPIIASWSFIGKLAGIGIAAASPRLFASLNLHSEEILLFNALIYVVGYFLIAVSLRNVSVRKTVQQTETVKETLTEGWDFVKGINSFRYLMIAIIALAVADTIIEFRFLVVTDAIFVGQGTYQYFYSMYRLAATLISFGVQTFLTGRLLNKMQVKNIFLFFPIVVLLGAGGALLSPTLWMVVSAMLSVKLIRETLDDSARKSIQSLVPEERRGRVSTFIDNYLPASGTILACLVTGAIVLIGIGLKTDLHLAYMSVAFICGAVAFWAVLRMRKVYESSLLNWRLKRRQRVSDTLIGKITRI